MADELNRDDVNRLIDIVRKAMDAHVAGTAETEAVRDTIEQAIAGAAGQLSEADRRAVALYAERLIANVWSETFTVDKACAEVEQLAAAGASNAPNFRELLSPGMKP